MVANRTAMAEWEEHRWSDVAGGSSPQEFSQLYIN
jgi:hypothetical protein